TRFSRDWSADVCSSDLRIHVWGKDGDGLPDGSREHRVWCHGWNRSSRSAFKQTEPIHQLLSAVWFRTRAKIKGEVPAHLLLTQPSHSFFQRGTPFGFEAPFCPLSLQHLIAIVNAALKRRQGCTSGGLCSLFFLMQRSSGIGPSHFVIFFIDFLRLPCFSK